MRLIATVDQRINQEVRAERLNAATYPVRGLEGSCAATGSPHGDGGPRHLKTDRFSFRRNRVILAA